MSASRGTRNPKPKSEPTKKRFSWPIAFAVVAGVAIISAALLAGTLDRGSTAGPPVTGIQESESPSESLNLARRIDGDPTALGSIDAPVVLVEYADYRCPFCGVFARDTMPLLVKEYVDSGQLRIEWRDFPVFGDESVAAAIAGRAAGEQGKFWEFHEVLFANAPERGHPELPRERLIEIATEIEVADIDRFTADLDNPELATAVGVDQAEAAAIGVTSTPIFLINDTPVSGAQPADVFREIIDAEIARAS